MTGAATGVGVAFPPKKTADGFEVGRICGAFRFVPYPAGRIIPAPGFVYIGAVLVGAETGAGAGVGAGVAGCTLTGAAVAGAAGALITGGAAALGCGAAVAGAAGAAGELPGCEARAAEIADVSGVEVAVGMLITAGAATGIAGKTEVESSGATFADHCVQVQVQPEP